MDFFSHGLWVGALYKALNLKRKAKEKFNVWGAVLWGVFPDLVTFTIPFVWMILGLIFGWFSFSQLPRPEVMEPSAPHLPAVFQLTGTLYSLSHSIIIFLIVFGLVCLIFKKPIWVLGGWGIHIIIDVFTHSYKFYPTPVFWPLSGWKFNGFSWGNLWFMIIDIVLLIAAYLILWIVGKRK